MKVVVSLVDKLLILHVNITNVRQGIPRRK
jgi:hypothetical protein